MVAPIPTKAHVQSLAAGEPTKNGALDEARPYEIFLDAARAADAEVIHLLSDLVAAETVRQKDGKSVYYNRDFHLNPHGNATVARTLYDAFDSLSLVPFLPVGGDAHRPSETPPSGGNRFPRWPFFYIGLVGLLGTLYTRTYTDEPTSRGYLKVALLLGVIFTIALGGGAILGGLPPVVARILLAALLIALLTFVAYKLGDRIGTIAELLRAFTLRGHWYLLPLLTILLTVGSLLVVAASSPLVAPFIYTLF